MSGKKRHRALALQPSTKTWRATTAVRVFTLALAVGQSLNARVLVEAAPVLFALVIISLVSVVAEVGVIDDRTPWVPIVEGVVVATLLTTSLPVFPLFVYLGVPPVVAGLRHGWVTTVNTGLSMSVAIVAASASYQELGIDSETVSAASPWLSIGIGAGLLAAWQSRSMRRLEAAQAPYASAHQLLSQLHALTKLGKIGLDSTTVAEEVGAAVSTATNSSAGLVLLRSEAGLVPCARLGNQEGLLTVAERCAIDDRPLAMGHVAAGLLRAEGRPFGVLALRGRYFWTDRDLANLQEAIDRHALRLDTALLFDEIRAMTTAEERHRLAREIHDGVAQQIVGLGYLVDEIEMLSTESGIREVAATLRQEITRMVTDLRFSIYDLRHQVAEQHLSGALAEYVREISGQSDLRAHVSFEEQGGPLPRRTETEVMRVVQEAIANVRRHARANNVWVTLFTDGDDIHLTVADDGVGSAKPRGRHYGLQTMRERAEKIGAILTVEDRVGGGTVVSLRSLALDCRGDNPNYEHEGPIGR